MQSICVFTYWSDCQGL